MRKVTCKKFERRYDVVRIRKHLDLKIKSTKRVYMMYHVNNYDIIATKDRD